MTRSWKKNPVAGVAKGYKASEQPHNKKRPLTQRLMKLEEYKRPQRRGGKNSRRTHRKARWVVA